MAHNLVLILGLLAVLGALVLVAVALSNTVSEREQVSRSLAAVDAIRIAREQARRDLDRPFSDRVIAPLLARLGRIGSRLSPHDTTAVLRHRLELAGSPVRWDVQRVLAFKMIGLAAGLVVGSMGPITLGADPAITVGVAIVTTVIGYFTPDLTLYQIAYNRSERMRRELADTLDLLTISVEAGLPFDSALSQVARNTRGPLADELFRVLQEMQIGLGRTEALRGLAERTNVAELRAFITAMVQADTFGIPIASVLRVQARDMRIKRSQRAEEQAQKVPVKILFPLIFCIMPSMFIVVMGPAAISAYHSFFH